MEYEKWEEWILGFSLFRSKSSNGSTIVNKNDLGFWTFSVNERIGYNYA